MMWRTKWTLRSVVGTTLLLSAVLFNPACGQDDDTPSDAPAPAKAERKEPRGRLPAYYGRLVDNKQREQIYRIQAGYNKQIEKLREELEQLLEQRNKEVRAVLSPEQQAELDAMVDAARKRRSSRRSSADEPAPESSPPTADE